LDYVTSYTMPADNLYYSVYTGSEI